MALLRLRVQMEAAFGFARDSAEADQLARFSLAAFDGAFVASQASSEVDLRELVSGLPAALIGVARALGARG